MKYQNTSIFDPTSVDPEDMNLPIFVGERKLLIMTPGNSDNKLLYDTFRNTLNSFIVKIPKTHAKSAVQKLIDRNLIFLGRDFSSPSKNGILGSFIINRIKFAGVLLDVVELDIDPETGETSRIESAFYATYFEFIRATVRVHTKEIKNNIKLHGDIIKYVNFLCLKLLSKSVTLSPRQKEFLDVLCSYFFYRFLIKVNHDLAKEYTYRRISTSLQKEVDPLIVHLQKYTYMRDIFKAWIDFKIINESPPLLMMKAISILKPTGFYAMTSTLDYLIALSIVSKYPFPTLNVAAVSSDLQNKIEVEIYKLIDNMSYDVTSVFGL